MTRIQRAEDRIGEDGERQAAQIAEGSRSLRNGVITLGVFCAIVVALLFGIPGLRSAGERITDANPLWVTGGVLLELLSCVGYVVLFDLVFGLSDRWLSSRLALSELAVNSAVSLSGVAGLALGAWVLRGEGMSAEQIAKRSVVIFLLTSAASVVAVIVIGVPMWLGLFKGSTKALITLGPAAVSLATVGAVLALARRARRVSARLDSYRHKRLAVALTGVGWGVLDALRVLRERDWRAARRGRVLAVRQPRAVRVHRGVRPHARRRSGPWRWPTWWAWSPTRCRSPAASSRSKAGSWACCCCSACAPPPRCSRPWSSTARSRCGCPR